MFVVEEGDIVVLQNCGAYVESMASTYNCRKILPSVFSDNVCKQKDNMNIIEKIIYNDISL